MGGETFPSPVAGPISLWLMNRKVGNVLTLNGLKVGKVLALNPPKSGEYYDPVTGDCFDPKPILLGNIFDPRHLKNKIFKIYIFH